MRPRSFALFLILLIAVSPVFAALQDFNAPTEKEIGQDFVFSVRVLDGSNNTMNATPCQVTVSTVTGELLNYFKPDEASKTLYTDDAGNLIYGFRLVSSIYQADNDYNVTVICPSGAVTQQFRTLPPATPNYLFNLILFAKNNWGYLLVALLIIFGSKFVILDGLVGKDNSNKLVALALAVVLVIWAVSAMFR